MGGRRLPHQEALSRAAAVMCIALGAVSSGCLFGGNDDEDRTPTAAVPTVSATASEPAASATPDRAATPPTDQVEARGWLQAVMGPSNYDPPCPQSLQQRGVACAEGDVDGDGKKDLAYLVPVKLPSTQLPFPATVFVRRGSSQKLDELVLNSSADSSILGRGFFGLADRSGDGNADLSYLQNECGATGCKTLAAVLSWDGNAWRPIGPGDEPIRNVDMVKWEGTGAVRVLSVHGGKLLPTAPPEAGPSRPATTIYRFVDTRFVRISQTPDEPEFLYHAVLDAEEVFKVDKLASIEAFAGLVDDPDLKDWKPPGATLADRRPALIGFALFRIVLAHAALQHDTATITAALDAVVVHGVQSGESLFVRISEEFRRGYFDRDGLSGGCAAVNEYINKVVPGFDTKAYIEQAFNYGYENDRGSLWIPRICPF